MTEPIERFVLRYEFLSNFFLIPVLCKGEVYPSVEHAYQAAKCVHPEDRAKIHLLAKPGAAKRMGRTVELVDNWDEIKLEVMLVLVRRKFKLIYMQNRLLATGDAELIEGNYWRDTFWGVYRGKGENHLGKILMQVRDEIRSRVRGG